MSRLLIVLGSFALLVSLVLFFAPPVYAGGGSTPCAEAEDCGDGICTGIKTCTEEEGQPDGCECKVTKT